MSPLMAKIRWQKRQELGEIPTTRSNDPIGGQQGSTRQDSHEAVAMTPTTLNRGCVQVKNLVPTSTTLGALFLR